MIEAYAFLAAFAVQVLVVSAVNTTRLVKYVRNWSANYGSERFAQVYPGVDLERWVGRFVTGYRAANAVIVLVGLVLLGWLFKVVQQPGWPAATTNLPTFYLMLQCSPLILLALYSLRYRKLFQEAQGTRRTASLQRRRSSRSSGVQVSSACPASRTRSSCARSMRCSWARARRIWLFTVFLAMP